MSNTNTGGGPAFPLHPSIRPALDTDVCGMTLRDWFAGKALQGATIRGWSPGVSMDAVAKQCYELADAMLKEREQ
jgi:hypothetical protein